MIRQFGKTKFKHKNKLKIFCGGNAAFFVFPQTCAAEKHLISEKPLVQRFFKDTGVVLAGMECSQKSLIFASGIPVQERVGISRHAQTAATGFDL